MYRQLIDDVHNRSIVLIDGHLTVQISNLTQMPVGEKKIALQHMTGSNERAFGTFVSAMQTFQGPGNLPTYLP